MTPGLLGKRGLKRRIGAWAGMAALSVHLLLSLAQAVPTRAMAEALPGMPEFLVICVAYGNVDNNDTDKKGNGGTPSCPVCLAEILAGGMIPASAAETAVALEYGQLRVVHSSDAPLLARQPLRRLSRAPPYFA